MRRYGPLAVVSLAMAGCGDGRVPVYPVTGKATVEGKPAVGWFAILHPESSEKFSHPYPKAAIDNDGRFSFRTYDYQPPDGAPAGKYRISFTWIPLANRVTEDEKSAEAEKPARQVHVPDTITIEPRPNELPEFEIK